MSDNTIDVKVSKIRNVWVRRVVVLLLLPAILAGNLILVVAALIPFWVRSNISTVKSAIEQWRRQA